MNPKLQELKQHLQEIADLTAVSAVLNWDQTTYMPIGGGPARARQLAIIARLSHERSIDPAIGKLLDALEPMVAQQPADSDDAALVRVARRNYERATRVPADLVARFSEHAATSYEAWAIARPANDFAAMVPILERTLEYSRQIAKCFPGYAHIADPLISWGDYGMETATVRTLFSQLREQLVPLVQAITARPAIEDSFLRQHYPEPTQLAFGEQIIRAFGYDFTRGRQDKTLHPYCTTFGIGDVRITTRVNEHDVIDGLFSTLHESGHAMYEQGVRTDFDASPLMGGTSSGVHESQSRLWENLVGRSRPFWDYAYPQLQATFPSQLGAIPLESFYHAINKVQRSLIRVDADEVTYNLHIIIRFDLELALLEGSLAVKDLAEAWRARYTSDLGITPPDDRDGVLQDVHWYAGLIGGSFQGYTIGNVMSAQFYDQALLAHPTIPQEVAAGQFTTLHTWLREQIYQHGTKYTASELLQRVTNGPMRIEPYIGYLTRKYSEIYAL